MPDYASEGQEKAIYLILKNKPGENAMKHVIS